MQYLNGPLFHIGVPGRVGTHKKFTIVGTMGLDRKGVPRVLRLVGKREAKSTLYMYNQADERMMMVSYIDKKTSGMKNVMVLTTMHNEVKVTNDQRQKFQVHSMYDHTKGGIDVVDLLSTMH